MSLYLSPPLSSFLPTPVFSPFHIKLLIISHPNMFFLLSLLCLYQPQHPPFVCVSPPASPHLSALHGLSRPPPLHFSLFHALLQGARRGKNEETKHFRLYTARGKAAVWCLLCCVRPDCFVCLACVCLCFSPPLHWTQTDRRIDELYGLATAMYSQCNQESSAVKHSPTMYAL